MNESEMYCPVCGRTIAAINADDVESGADDGYVFVHDEIPHDDSDLIALGHGVQ